MGLRQHVSKNNKKIYNENASIHCLAPTSLHDLSVKEQGLILATQIPANKSLFGAQSGVPAWKTKPSWYIISKSDKAINPDLERFFAKRANAKVTEIESSHVVMLSHPKEVLTVIKEAAAVAK